MDAILVILASRDQVNKVIVDELEFSLYVQHSNLRSLEILLPFERTLSRGFRWVASTDCVSISRSAVGTVGS